MMSTKRYDANDLKSQDEFFNTFRTYDEIQAWVRRHANNTLCSLITVGKSYQGRDIIGLKIEGNTNVKPSILYHGGIHAREWISPTTVMWIANELIIKYNTDPVVKSLVDRIQWHIFPVLNVDGYVYTHTNDRMWRKTRSPNQGSTCIGTDPNRNWDYRWNSGGSSTNPCSETFHGPRPFSEVESKQMADYGTRLMPNLRGYTDFHAFGELYMRPWGYTTAAPADEARFAAIGDAAAVRINSVRRRNYRSGRIAVIIYVASGSTADWFYGVHKTYAYALELGTGFVMPTSEIRPVGIENFEGVKVYAERILQQWDEEKGVALPL